MPSVHEARYEFIDAAAESYRPFHDLLLECLGEYGFEDFHDFVVTEDEARANALVRTWCHPAVQVEAAPLDGMLDPIPLPAAKRNLLVWCLHRTLTSYSTFSSAFGAQNGVRAPRQSDALAAFRLAARQDMRRFIPDDFTWIAQKQMIRNCLEGSNRSRQGRQMEERAREALRELIGEGWNFRVNDRELQIRDEEGVKHRVDIVLENASRVLVLHMKSSQLLRHGYSGIYGRETAATTAAVRAVLGRDRAVESMTIFAGQGWNGDRLPEISNPFQIPSLVGLEKDRQRAALLAFFRGCPLIGDFRSDSAACRRVAAPAVTPASPVPAQVALPFGA